VIVLGLLGGGGLDLTEHPDLQVGLCEAVCFEQGVQGAVQADRAPRPAGEGWC
jgi:hypothetical protein